METQELIINKNCSEKNKFGYVRVSTMEQNIDRQIEELQKKNLYRIYIEKASAKDTKRPILNQLLDYVREGDVIYIKDFSRIARSTKDLLSIIENLNTKNIKLVSLKENFNTETPTGKLMITMMGAIYEFERENLLERQREGIAIAKRKGKYKGRKQIEKPDNWDEVIDLYMTRQVKAFEAMEQLNIKRGTFYKLLKEYKTNTNINNLLENK